ncbi:MAG: response regulator transcription factor [Chloroflexi bacterium]|nr:response regulator transcription factor [Chloroflexota bacterium]
MKLLIVDDHILFRDGLVSLFSTQPDFEVVGQAGSVHEAIEAASTLRPELILMDYGLPDGTGADACREILAKLPGCRIVFLTVYETDEQLFSGMRSGAKGYLLKSMPFPKMLRALQSLKQDEMIISRSMTCKIVKEFARTQPAEPAGNSMMAALSPREEEIMKEILSGATNKEIAYRLFISENTVKHHVHSILDKLGLKNRLELARVAPHLGFSPPL